MFECLSLQVFQSELVVKEFDSIMGEPLLPSEQLVPAVAVL
jgi:hypothetical protein